jgi:FMN-dependent NADH-azoreductase
VDHLLHIDSSARTTASLSRQLTKEFTAHWVTAHPGGVVTYRDLAATPLPHIQEATIAAMTTPPAARTAAQTLATALQEELIAELAAADTVVLGVPMYNYSIPSALKSWIDHVVVFGRTVGQGLFDGTRVVIINTRGGAYGLTDITMVNAEMRAAIDGEPTLAQFVPFAVASLAAAQATLLATADRPPA